MPSNGYFAGPLSIQGIQEVQQRNLRRILALKPEGTAGEAVRDALIALQRYAVQVTHVGRYVSNGSGGFRYASLSESARGGGALKNSHRIRLGGLYGEVYIDPSSTNPLTNQKPVEYGVYENARGGEHAFYDRTVSEAGPGINDRARAKITDAVLYAK